MLETLEGGDDEFDSRAEYLLGKAGPNRDKPEIYFRVLEAAPFTGAMVLDLSYPVENQSVN